MDILLHWLVLGSIRNPLAQARHAPSLQKRQLAEHAAEKKTPTTTQKKKKHKQMQIFYTSYNYNKT